jgi:hypothetical protein
MHYRSRLIAELVRMAMAEVFVLRDGLIRERPRSVPASGAMPAGTVEVSADAA